MGDYDNIIEHPHHQSKTRPHMPMTKRAAQFSPFAALTGYEELIMESQRLTEERVELDEDAAAELNRKLQQIDRGQSSATITYFIPDMQKSGGAYTIATGEIKKIDKFENRLIMADGTTIYIDDIFDISFDSPDSD